MGTESSSQMLPEECYSTLTVMEWMSTSHGRLQDRMTPGLHWIATGMGWSMMGWNSLGISLRNQPLITLMGLLHWPRTTRMRTVVMVTVLLIIRILYGIHCGFGKTRTMTAFHSNRSYTRAMSSASSGSILNIMNLNWLTNTETNFDIVRSSSVALVHRRVDGLGTCFSSLDSVHWLV